MRETTGAAGGEARNTRLWNTIFNPRNVKGYAISVAVGALLAVSGAFETYALPIWARFAYWVPTMVVGAVIGSIVSDRIIVIERWARSMVLAWALVTLMVAVPMTVLVWFTTSLAFGDTLNIARIAFFAPYVIIVSGFMAGILTFVNQTPRETQSAGDPSAPIRFLERLPIKLRGATIYAVSAEDHYLRLHTSRGTDLILMRLSDAIGELDGIEGAQVHRSWWVARGAIKDVARGEGKAVFTLTDNTQVPVSRTYAKALREAGWY